MLAFPSPVLDMTSIGERLAHARLTGELTDLDLAGLADLDAAEDVRDAALRKLGWAQVGYALVGTHLAVARTLRLDVPVVAPLMRETVLENSSTLRLPRGVLGAGVSLSFLLGRSFPFTDEEPLTARNASQACLACRIDLHVLGRRTLSPAVLDERSATADLGLDVAHVAGPWIEGWAATDLAATEASLAIDGHVVVRGHGRDVMGDPFAAVAWLARRLTERGSGLSAGDLVSVGSCTGLAQVLPGQTLSARFGHLGTVSLELR
ncbi:MAG TPA: fumarylacetoacetate hydrolase family protein [Methylobacterium sp.]|jgi:2-keto-4-pentenoate hydratase|uniref:2-keto-4-pentenoate hydratase n=1 Tax=Methylorubrum sp. B1-46 TaxID=2897334 RepID=UPI001E5F6A76|nr:fumarylacetoacetate hydrolase family protein [Methylorubrum sp. B1-46]UGB27256.1 fumarylacetoacetate hydrolase family protein [Methylorubrum sp. B1-46]HEV2542614.1 fumarylacetoacetate hydrolase family protein [Methylobacterium sp.]